MTLIHIVLLSTLSIPFMTLIPPQQRSQGLTILSIAVVAWLFAEDTLNNSDLLLLSITIGLVVLTWWIIKSPESNHTGFQQHIEIALPLLLIVLFGLFLGSVSIQFAITYVVIGVLTVGFATPKTAISNVNSRQLALFAVLGIIAILVILKAPPLAEISGFLVGWDASSLATASPLLWLGFSYVSFRLIAVLLDYRAGRLPKEGYALSDLVTYTLFFPAYTAGPIDRAQRFIPELQSAKSFDAAIVVEGFSRIAVGIFKKFVIADTLAIIALSPVLVEQTTTTTGMWLLVYLYALQIYFDFSGYSDVAIGIGRLYGIKLPENFDRPYLQRNIQQFWQRWHITLSTWFRLYFFTPFSRTMIRSQYDIPQWFIVLAAQMSTMILIGMWHGITLNFVLWGAWHGLGLFLHKMLADNTKSWYRKVQANTWSRRLMAGASVLATFHFVALGWVFFALPDFSMSLEVFGKLFVVSN